MRERPPFEFSAESCPEREGDAVKRKRFSVEQMVAILREADRTSVAETAKKHEVSEQTIYGWRKHFGGLQPADVKRLK